MGGFNPFMFGNPAGVGQQTAVGQTIVSNASRGSATGTRRRRSKAKAAPAARRRKTKRAGKARLVKGSRAAKAYMAKIRRKRK